MSESYAVGWGSLALINANLAQLKGKSGTAWFLGSPLGGPIVTFLFGGYCSHANHERSCGMTRS